MVGHRGEAFTCGASAPLLSAPTVCIATSLGAAAKHSALEEHALFTLEWQTIVASSSSVYSSSWLWIMVTRSKMLAASIVLLAYSALTLGQAQLWQNEHSHASSTAS